MHVHRVFAGIVKVIEIVVEVAVGTDRPCNEERLLYVKVGKVQVAKVPTTLPTLLRAPDWHPRAGVGSYLLTTLMRATFVHEMMLRGGSLVCLAGAK